MNLLLAQVPLLYRWLMIAALMATVFGYGWVKGNVHGTAKGETYQAQTEALAQAQTDRANRINAALKQTMKEANDAHQTTLAALRARYRAGWMPVEPGSSQVPAIPANPQEPGQTAPDPMAAAGGDEIRIDLADCAETTLMVIDLQHAWKAALSATKE